MVNLMNRIAAEHHILPEDSAQEVIEELPVAYIELNAEGIVLRANRAARALYPHEHGKFIGETLWNLMAADEREISRAAFLKIMESGENPPTVRRTIYTSAGGYRTFELHRSLRRGGEGQVAGMRMVSFDVTEAQLAHEAAHQARQRLESVLASVAEAVIVTDVLGFVCSVNPAAEEMLGWKAEEMAGKVIEKGMPMLSYISAEHKTLTHRIALEKRTRGIATVVDRNHCQLRVEITTSPIVDKDNGITTGVVSVLRRVD